MENWSKVDNKVAVGTADAMIFDESLVEYWFDQDLYEESVPGEGAPLIAIWSSSDCDQSVDVIISTADHGNRFLASFADFEFAQEWVEMILKRYKSVENARALFNRSC